MKATIRRNIVESASSSLAQERGFQSLLVLVADIDTAGAFCGGINDMKGKGKAPKGFGNTTKLGIEYVYGEYTEDWTKS